MSLGFNSQVQCNDGFYHVQTEDRGLAHPFVDTLVLFQGQVLHRCSRSYKDMLVSGAIDSEALRARVEQQHRDILGALRSGSLPLDKVTPAETPAFAIKLCNPGSWLVAGKASIEVEVRARRNGMLFAGAIVEASIQSGTFESDAFLALTDGDGQALVCFSLPEMAKEENADLVIKARLREMHSEIRYRLKPNRSKASLPANE